MSITLPEHKKGDTFNGQQFTLNINGSPADLTGASIRMDLRKVKTGPYVLRLSTDNGGISILVPVSGIFQINPQIIDVQAATYFYDIETTFQDGTVKTYIDGTWLISQDVTYG